MLTIKIQPVWLRDSRFVRLLVEVKSPDLPEGQFTFTQDFEQSEFESLFDVIWKRAYYEITRHLRQYVWLATHEGIPREV